jgi:hypothetical protein
LTSISRAEDFLDDHAGVDAAVCLQESDAAIRETESSGQESTTVGVEVSSTDAERASIGEHMPFPCDSTSPGDTVSSETPPVDRPEGDGEIPALDQPVPSPPIIYKSLSLNIQE